ncbi:MAG: L-aspartate oxidase [Patescibacteria group bacterium]
MQHYDVIVIGSGISGLNFALRAAEKSKRVLVVTKKEIALANTNFAQGGIAAVLSTLDNFEKHIKDTIVAGAFHNDKKAVRYMVQNGPAAIARLVELGVPFTSQHGKIMLTREGGHSERRIAFVADLTGQAIEKVLVDKARRNPFITLYEHTFAADLIVEHGRCYGVQILRDKKFENIFADMTVIATGGAGQLFENTTNPEISTGDGIAMASRAGCEFRDLEFVQFHPTALYLKGKPRFLISEAVRGEGAYLLNKKGKRFMIGKHPLAELAPRDIVARAIFEEEKSGQVYMDLRHKDADFIKTRFPNIYQTLKEYGLNITKDLIPISPAAHYICGGIKVDLRGETNVKNLYAFGEVTGTGVHGANRLASNSLLEALVFSDKILRAKKLPHNFPKQIGARKFLPASKKEAASAKKLRTQLRKTMWNFVGIIRSQKSLLQATNELKKITAQLQKMRTTSKEILELKNMALAASLITKAALARKKSLGCHYRVN